MQVESFDKKSNPQGYSFFSIIPESWYSASEPILSQVGKWGISLTHIFPTLTEHQSKELPISSSRPLADFMKDEFLITEEMLPYLNVLGIEAKMDEPLEPAIIHRQYKHQARKVHPDRNNSDNANSDFVTLKNAYDSILKLSEKQLGLFQADNSFQSRGNPVDVELHDLQREFKNLGQNVSNYHQNITKFTQGVSTFSHRVDEVHITARDYKSEAKKYIEKANQHIQSMSQRLAINGAQLQDLYAQSHELKLTETTIEQQLQDNQKALDDLVAQTQRLLNPSENDVQQPYSTHGFFFNASPNVSEDAPFSSRSFNP